MFHKIKIGGSKCKKVRMAYESAFRERLADMETTRNHRVCLLQDEKELQSRKSLVLSAKHSRIRLLEQRCLMFDHKLASHHFNISSLKSEIEFLDRKYLTCAQHLRDLKVEVEELEQLDNDRETFYAVKYSEMNEFKTKLQNFSQEIGSRVKDLKASRDKSDSMEHNSRIEAAEMRRSELLASKQKVASSLESNKRVRAMLQQQIRSLR